MPYAISDRSCTNCHRHGEEHRVIRSRDRGEYFLSLCRSCERDRNTARPTRTRSPRIPRLTAQRLGAARKFGVEIECNISGGRYGVAARRIEQLLPTNWRLKSDGSLGSDGCEVVGPPLSGDTGLDQLRQVLALLVDNGATVDQRCGLHVHHDVRDIGREGLPRFIRTWAANQDLIDWLVSPSRRQGRNSYCGRWSGSELSGLSHFANTGRTNVTRYKTANVQSFSKYGTVEIRQHQGTLSFRKIEAWIKLTQAMLDTAAESQQAQPRSIHLRNLLERNQVEEDTAAFLLGRAMQFQAPARDLIAA